MSGQLHAPTVLPPGNNPTTYSVGGWVGHRVYLDGFGEGINTCLCRIRSRTVQSVINLYTDYILYCFLDRAFSVMKTKINQQNAQINSG